MLIFYDAMNIIEGLNMDLTLQAEELSVRADQA